jgi:hypothetical protein
MAAHSTTTLKVESKGRTIITTTKERDNTIKKGVTRSKVTATKVTRINTSQDPNSELSQLQVSTPLL